MCVCEWVSVCVVVLAGHRAVCGDVNSLSPFSFWGSQIWLQRPLLTEPLHYLTFHCEPSSLNMEAWLVSNMINVFSNFRNQVDFLPALSPNAAHAFKTDDFILFGLRMTKLPSVNPICTRKKRDSLHHVKAPLPLHHRGISQGLTGAKRPPELVLILALCKLWICKPGKENCVWGCWVNHGAPREDENQAQEFVRKPSVDSLRNAS